MGEGLYITAEDPNKLTTNNWDITGTYSGSSADLKFKTKAAGDFQMALGPRRMTH